MYALILISMGAIAQTTASIEANGVYLSDSAFLRHRLIDAFAHAKGNLNDNRKNYLVIEVSERRDTFYFDNIWGFRKAGEDWRIFNGEYYKVDFVNNKICLYSVPGTGQSEGIRTRHYFSVSPVTPVHHLGKRELLAAFSGNQAFCEKIRKMSFTRSVFKWDKVRQNYVFVNWL
ncbi:MAG: hypothetical protein DI535_00125 [Citrobacter freundii]|nr:MAG: hypothetical protein DI535_00125 [Citrobacter freundii]